MNRAVILIGVQKAHNLPLLQAVLACVEGMEEWALAQGIPPDRIKIITDANDRVTPQNIKDAVNELLMPGDLEQLIVYFAGHGVNLGYAEYWLLSDAIIDSDAAVNVKASEERARSSSIPHVVFISDACRTAADGIQAQGILGSTIFRNLAAAGPAKPVDLFFATMVGDPALEINDPNDAAQGFKAVYTEALLEGLRGQHPEIAEPDASEGGYVIRPWPLQEYLANELPRRVYQATMGPNPLSQIPEARIASKPGKAWISLVRTPVDGASPPVLFSPPPPADDARKHSKLANLASSRVTLATRAILADSESQLDSALISIPIEEPISRSELDVFSNANRRFSDDVRYLAEPFGPMQMETRSGFKIRGGQIIKCTGAIGSHVFDDGSGADAPIPVRSACNYLLEFKNGTGAVLPAAWGFLTSLTFKDDQLIDVTYEPSENTDRWKVYKKRAGDIRALRAAVAAATRMGTFRLQSDDASKLARRMQLLKGIDPSLALYAAHAYRDQGNRDRIQTMATFIREDLGFCPFDIALLDGQLNGNVDDPLRKHILPFLPMLSQSWALLPAYDVKLAHGLAGIYWHVLPNSLWTLLGPDGVSMVRNVLQKEGFQ
jgi:hypothetical protein